MWQIMEDKNKSTTAVVFNKYMYFEDLKTVAWVLLNLDLFPHKQKE